MNVASPAACTHGRIDTYCENGSAHFASGRVVCISIEVDERTSYFLLSMKQWPRWRHSRLAYVRRGHLALRYLRNIQDSFLFGEENLKLSKSRSLLNHWRTKLAHVAPSLKSIETKENTSNFHSELERKAGRTTEKFF